MKNLSNTYRFRALECEKIGRSVENIDLKRAWADIAIEWHALAAQVTLEASRVEEMEAEPKGRRAQLAALLLV
jgi:hypothetical protein